jgi:putative hydrolase of the HAD superfamily
MSGSIATLIRRNRMKSGIGTNKSQDYLSPYQGTLAHVSRSPGLGAGRPSTRSTVASADISQPSRLPSTLANPLDSDRKIAAVLFDLDGTLYDQRRMRALMAIELASLALTQPLRAPRRWRVLAAYRKAQESLRSTPLTGRTQLEVVTQRTGLPAAEVEEIVGEWMFERPLKYLPACRATGVFDLLRFLTSRGVQIGVLSDYPADAKLRALGLDGWFSVVLCSSDPKIGALKPDPRGFLAACERWQLDPGEVLVVGDRFDVDAAGADAAGMPCVIIRRHPRIESTNRRSLVLPSLERLHRVLDKHC